MKKVKLILVIVFCVLIPLISCSSDSGDNSSNNKPSNLVVNTEIVGLTASLPNGDGSGVVNFIISADNATSYKLLIGTETITSTSGIVSHTFNQSGTNTYTIYVSAYNGNEFISTTVNLTVYVTPSLVWSDEFNVNGSPDNTKWSYETGTGSGGWGNNELQYYTNRPENVKVENGLLKITAIKENYSGSAYTSGRIVTKDKYSVKYGRIDIRAKLPIGGGTWPALWMLGNNISSAGWPACGEIDIMEHVGNDLNRIHGTLHYPGHSGGNADSSSILISNVSSEFHVYSIDWNASFIKFYVDNQLFYTFNNGGNLPFNQPFFFILNCAMGGNFGGSVDPNFVSSTLEVDYVRVYN
ncbi:glycoside hydrolase family 16 protein [Flavobacterium capsici]|uniref:Glycoside hydrolase family 16 protein n=1 Tax=Flavobacterium capsici TaxID=3075618 RepID=A0AA96F5Y0_9FLAO|nr:MULTISPECIES: glycoside hydrolase family 16 protein [unclassified Flavobacterium]WNM18078.1 glycoside hydrolase family 16 protein [Flavobacterium sp. PMR2A8]WNM22130.1 glycoside hydrolase family 16 protein [Flavobacterium sp. PMTSA4]